MRRVYLLDFYIGADGVHNPREIISLCDTEARKLISDGRATPVAETDERGVRVETTDKKYIRES